MRQRCLNPKVPNYHRYGGRGIKICEQWNNFETFLEDMGMRPSPRHSIDRRNNDGNYEPANCYWATREQQGNNMGKNIRLTYGNKTMTIAQWARHLGVSYDYIKSRHRYGWDAKSIIETPKNLYHSERKNTDKNKLLTYNGKTMNMAQWAKRIGCSYDTIRARQRYGWDDERIITTPTKKNRLYPHR